MLNMFEMQSLTQFF